MKISNNQKEVTHNDLANAIRFLSIDAVEKAKSGHPGLPMGMADVATVLFRKFLKFNPGSPKWHDRDRFILSAGHGSMLLYSLLFLTGYKDISIRDIKNFRQLNGKCAGHPEFGHISGIETTTGPLGQGLGNAVGMALMERLLANEFGNKMCNHFTYVIASDGDLMEGISHEAASFAGHQKLNKLIVFFDDNGISIDGPVKLSNSEKTIDRFKSYNWNTIKINGHKVDEIEKAIKKAQKSSKPTIISCKTKIGYGSPNKQGKSSSHGSPLGIDEVNLTRKKLNWNFKPFVIPKNISEEWLLSGKRSKGDFSEWKKNFDKLSKKKKIEYNRRINGVLPKDLKKILNKFKKNSINNPISTATRQSSEMVINAIAPHMPELLGGSADLTGSNNTKGSKMLPLDKSNHSGKYIYYGIREHGMAAIMNGIALHGGAIPFGGTFLIFVDYLKPSLRLSALMNQRAIYILTHDSIGLGEDGPTHQPIEQLASLRATPNLNVFRPADTIETAESWELALSNKKGPSVIALTRQKLEPVRKVYKSKNLSELGAYELISNSNEPDISIFASGSEVQIALEMMKILNKKKKKVRIISVPSFELFLKQNASYRKKIHGKSKLNVTIEAASGLGWNLVCPNNAINISIEKFGASAPYQKLYETYGLTAKKILKKINNKI